MKVQATYRHVFTVTREVEVDEVEFLQWAQDKYGDEYDTELAIAAWIDDQDDEFHSEVFQDWRTNKPGTVLLTDLHGSEPDDVVFELEWHGLDARLVEAVVGGESE